jgi:hypothetical protein
MEHQRFTDVKQEFLFYVFQLVSQANTVNMNGQPLNRKMQILRIEAYIQTVCTLITTNNNYMFRLYFWAPFSRVQCLQTV